MVVDSHFYQLYRKAFAKTPEPPKIGLDLIRDWKSANFGALDNQRLNIGSGMVPGFSSTAIKSKVILSDFVSKITEINGYSFTRSWISQALCTIQSHACTLCCCLCSKASVIVIDETLVKPSTLSQITRVCSTQRPRCKQLEQLRS